MKSEVSESVSTGARGTANARSDATRRQGSPVVRVGHSLRTLRPMSFQMVGESREADAQAGLAYTGPSRGHGWLDHFRFDCAGAPWLDGAWLAAALETPHRSARWLAWRSQPEYDFAEWSLRVGEARIRRMAFLLRGRRLAILAQQTDAMTDRVDVAWKLAAGITARLHGESRAIALRHRSAAETVVAYPIGLPRADYETDRGRFESEDDSSLRLNQAATGRRTLLPLVLSWHPERERAEPNWRALTVTQDRKICKPGVAFAARLGWRGEPNSLVFYTSLAKPALRCFLGYHTSARLVIGLFSQDGELEPILAIGGSTAE